MDSYCRFLPFGGNGPEKRHARSQQFFENPCFCAIGILKLVRNSSSSHQRVTVHGNSPEKRYQRVKKDLQLQIRATNSDLRRNRLLGFNVAWYTERVLENVFSGSKNPQVQSNWATGYDLQRNRLLGINVLRYTERVLENVLSRTENPQVKTELYTMICDEIVS